ncbi:MAG: hypothetical protein WAN75_43055, partial [Xanthobacteraceae bacterium]
MSSIPGDFLLISEAARFPGPPQDVAGRCGITIGAQPRQPRAASLQLGSFRDHLAQPRGVGQHHGP